MKSEIIREKSLDLLFLLALPQEEHAKFFPDWVPFPIEIATEVEFVAKRTIEGSQEGDAGHRSNLAAFPELISIDALMTLASPEADFWSAEPLEWRWLWDVVRDIANNAASRHHLGVREVRFAKDTRVKGGST